VKPVTAYEVTYKKKVYTLSADKRTRLRDLYSDAWNDALSGYPNVIRTKNPALSSDLDIAVLTAVLKKANPALKAKRIKEDKESDRKYAAQVKKDEADRKATLAALIVKFPLPDGLALSDLTRPFAKDSLSYDDHRELAVRESCDTGYGGGDFTVYYTAQFGWCVPTLRIRGAGQTGYKPRSYGVALKGGSLVRLGRGPHILAEISVYLKKSNIKKLAPILEVIRTGAVAANETRDRISTRMANRRRFY